MKQRQFPVLVYTQTCFPSKPFINVALVIAVEPVLIPFD